MKQSKKKAAKKVAKAERKFFVPSEGKLMTAEEIKKLEELKLKDSK